MALDTPIIYFGTEDFSLTPLKDLVEAGFNVKAVVTKPDSARGRGNKLDSPAVKKYAIEKGIKVLQPIKLSEIYDDIREINAPIAVLASYGKIIPASIIDIFEFGIVNIHPSLLPKYRGPSPIESAILNGDTETGVSIMKLEVAMDAGPVFVQESLKLNGTETKAYLYDKLAEIGSRLLLESLPKIISGDLQPQEQVEEQATYCNMIKKEDGIIDRTKPAKQIEREIRAYAGWPKSRTTLGNKDVIITKAHAGHERETQLDIVCAGDSGPLYLCIDQLIGPSGKLMTAKEFINGYYSA